MRANERHLRIDFDSPGAAFNFGAVALAQERELKHREDPVFLVSDVLIPPSFSGSERADSDLCF